MVVFNLLELEQRKRQEKKEIEHFNMYCTCNNCSHPLQRKIQLPKNKENDVNICIAISWIINFPEEAFDVIAWWFV